MNIKLKARIISVKFRQAIANEKGVVLNVVLMLLGILSLLGVTAAVLALTDAKISDKYTDGNQAFFAAEGAIEEVKARLKGSESAANYVGDPVNVAPDYNPDVTWSAYLLSYNTWLASDDPGYDSSYKNYIPTSASHTSTSIALNSLQTNLAYWVKIKHKQEYDAERDGHATTSPHYSDGDGSTSTHTSSSPGNIIYYGYPSSGATTPSSFTTTGATPYHPVELITAYGKKGDSLQVVQIELGRNPGPPTPAAVYGQGNITINGGSGFLSGNDSCGQAGAKPPVYTMSPATTTGSPTYEGSPATPQSGSLDIDIDEFAENLKQGATVITEDQSGVNFGSPTNFVTLYSNTSNPPNVGGLKIQNGTGYGILIVEGDLTLGGGFNWDGIILVTGTLTFNGGGDGINIKGAVLATSSIDINGGLDIRYDSCQIDKSLQSKPLVLVKWKQVY